MTVHSDAPRGDAGGNPGGSAGGNPGGSAGGNPEPNPGPNPGRKPGRKPERKPERIDVAGSVLVASPARIEAAAALRRLGHALVGHDIDDKYFHRISAAIDQLLPVVESYPARSRSILEMKRRQFAEVPPDGGTVDHFPDCIVSGAANPMGVAARAWRDGEEAVVRVTLGAAFEGAPSRAHGGVVAAIFDDTMGFVLTIRRTPAYTGRISVSYLAPTPIGEEIEFRARCTHAEGRKITMTGEARHRGKVIAEAEALFITVPQDRLAPGPPAPFPPGPDRPSTPPAGPDHA